MAKKEIRFCLKCGIVKKMSYNGNECPECNLHYLAFFNSESHLFSYINRYGLGNMYFKDIELLDKVIEKFN